MKCMLVLVLLAVAGVAAASQERVPAFQTWMQKHGRTYESFNEYQKRLEIFSRNLDMIEGHNARKLNWTMALNEYADMDWQEFRALKFSSAPTKRHREARNPVDLSGLVNAPASKDWTTEGAVTAVKNQGQCGSCWSFSTTGSIEGAVYIKTGQLVSLSEQQLVDCSGSYGDYGCNGGLMDYAFDYVIATGGLQSETDYPYEARDDTCRSSRHALHSPIKGYQDVARDNEEALKCAVAMQPVSVAIEADQYGFQFYSSGVFDGYCGTRLDHGVLAVGYGTENGQDYWKIKNSWGANWGDSGYIKIARNVRSSQGQCGVAMQPSYPIA